MAVLQSTNVVGTLCVNGVAVGGGKDFYFCCFTASTTWTPTSGLVSADGVVDAVLVGGGGQGAGACGTGGGSGGGGGDVKTILCQMTSSNDTCTVTVGAGGNGVSRVGPIGFHAGNGCKGGDTTFAGVTAYGGGGGGRLDNDNLKWGGGMHGCCSAFNAGYGGAGGGAGGPAQPIGGWCYFNAYNSVLATDYTSNICEQRIGGWGLLAGSCLDTAQICKSPKQIPGPGVWTSAGGPFGAGGAGGKMTQSTGNVLNVGSVLQRGSYTVAGGGQGGFSNNCGAGVSGCPARTCGSGGGGAVAGYCDYENGGIGADGLVVIKWAE